MAWMVECPVCKSRQVVLDRADPLAPHWIGDKLDVCPGSLKPGNFIGPAR